MRYNGSEWSDVRVILYNFSNEEYAVKKGSRIALMIIERYHSPKFVEVHEFTKESERGEGGFGSTSV